MRKTSSRKIEESACADSLISSCEQAAGLLRAMSNPTRLHILCLLAEKERAVGELTQSLGIRDQATSQQLAQLRLEGLITARKDGQRVFYSLASDKIGRILATLREIYGAPERH